MDGEKVGAYLTLYEALVTLTKLLAPITPFLAEEMYTKLVARGTAWRHRVHLTDWPVADPSLVDQISKPRHADPARGEPGPLGPRAGEDPCAPAAGGDLCARGRCRPGRLLRLGYQALDELNVKALRPWRPRATC